MKITKNDCVGCDSVFGYCKGLGCPYYGDYEALACDECQSEEDELYRYEDTEICADCLLEKFEKITW